MLCYLASAMLFFLPPSSPQLNQKSKEVCPCEILSDEVQTLIDQMYNLAFEHANLVGLAAPQTGQLLRIILVDIAATCRIEPPSSQIEVFINPEIIWESESCNFWYESCSSTSNFFGIVPRQDQILIRAYDREGNLFTQKYEGFIARIFQHEIDHLDGTCFPDRLIKKGQLHWVEDNEIEQYRMNWKNWPSCPWENWLNLRN